MIKAIGLWLENNWSQQQKLLPSFPPLLQRVLASGIEVALFIALLQVSNFWMNYYQHTLTYFVTLMLYGFACLNDVKNFH